MKTVISLIENTLKNKEAEQYSLLTEYSMISEEISTLRSDDNKAKECSLYHYLSLERRKADLTLEVGRLTKEIDQLRKSLKQFD